MRREMPVQLSTEGRSRVLDNTTNADSKKASRIDSNLGDIQRRTFSRARSSCRKIDLRKRGLPYAAPSDNLLSVIYHDGPWLKFFRGEWVSLFKTRRDRSRSTCEMGAERGRRGPRRSRAWEMDEPLKLAEIEGRGELRRELPREWIERDLGH